MLRDIGILALEVYGILAAGVILALPILGIGAAIAFWVL